MSSDTGYVCVVRNKETKVYAIYISFDVEEKFEDLGVGDKNELVMHYWVMDNFKITCKLYEKFAKKRIPESDYLQLTKKDLDGIKRLLKEEKKYTDIVIKQYGDAFWLQKFKEKREKYSKATDLKKFFMRHNNKFNIALSAGVFLLILSPVVAFGIALLNAIGISKYFFVAVYFGLFFFLLWEGNKNDKYEQKDLLSDEEEIIKRHQEYSKKI